MTDTQFRTAFRGYEPADVDPVLEQLRKAVSAGNDEVGRVNVELAKARASVDELAAARDAAVARAEALEQQLATAGRPTYADLGATVGRILTLAEQEAKALREGARTDAEKLTADARAAADALKERTEREAAEMASKAQADAAQVLEAARRKADDILDHADRESSARRAEAEAVYEHQRQRATAAAADFEQTLAERRGDATREFEGLLTGHTQQLSEATARRDAAEAEAARLLEEAQHQSRSLLEAAQAEASQLVTTARATADRVRQDSDRELAAATQRRDSITAQLANVRQMLATLGQGVASTVAEVAGEPEVDDEVAAEPDATASDDVSEK